MNTQYFGQNVESLQGKKAKLIEISERIHTKKKLFDTMENKLKRMNDLNKKLSEGYELSMKMVVDVSQLLHNYTKMFDDLEVMLSKIDNDMGIKDVDIRYVSELTKDSIKKISIDFNNQYPSIIVALEKQGNRESLNRAANLKAIVNQLPSDIDYFQRKSIGGNKKKK
jgi:hypothetical protein